MAITLSLVQTLLISRASGRMEMVGMDALTKGTTNPDLLDPLSFALLLMDIIPSALPEIVDADFSTLQDADLTQLLDLAELRLLENIVGRATMVDVQVGPRKENFSQMVRQVEVMIGRLNRKMEDLYGYGANAMAAGVITLDFATKGDDELIDDDDAYPL